MADGRWQTAVKMEDNKGAFLEFQSEWEKVPGGRGHTVGLAGNTPTPNTGVLALMVVHGVTVIPGQCGRLKRSRCTAS
jgi:hypothetical protein